MSPAALPAAPARTGYRWWVVFLLLAIFVLSYVDRFILSLVIEPLKKALNLSDFQIGLLLGPAFSLVHLGAGIPLGWWADRGNRKYLLLGGILIWCAATVGSGLATTFAMLFVLRLGLGLGEAVVSPGSLSIISDYFDRRERPRAISIFMAGPYLGAGTAFLIGGGVIGYLTHLGPTAWPVFGVLQPWQAAFVLVGLPGFLLAALLLTVREPERREVAAAPVGTAASAYMAARWRAYGTVIVGATCNLALATLAFWNVPLFSRTYGWSVAQTGFFTGLFYFTAGPVATAIAVAASRRFGERHADASLRVLMLGLAIGVPASALYPLMPTAPLALVVMFVAFIGKSVGTAGGPAALGQITPGAIRTRVFAIFNAFVSLVGPLLGPPLIGATTDWTGDPAMLRYVISGFVLLIGVPAVLVTWLGLGQYRATAQAFEAEVARAEGVRR